MTMTTTMTTRGIPPATVTSVARILVLATLLVQWGQGYIQKSIFQGRPKQMHATTSSTSFGRDRKQQQQQQRHLKIQRTTTTSSTTCLFGDLWERMNLMEDEEPMWYVLNCVAGNERELMTQCRSQFKYLDLSPEDRKAVKFVVPTITTTRSHGAKRMVQDTKVKYQGYVFAHIRLTATTYEAIQALPLHRSFMGGGINQVGFKKLPPAPIPLTYEEIEKYGLEDIEYNDNDIDTAAPQLNENKLEIIVDTVELEQEEIATESAIEKIVQTVYCGLQVEDMIKVTAKNKFHGEDGTVRRLKDGKVKIRFFTYGQAYEEWLLPTDVRKMTDAEAMRGLTEGAPITQRDIEGGGDQRSYDRGGRDGRFDNQNRRNEVGNFGGGPRSRRQDRTAQSYNNKNRDDGEANWKWYQDNERVQEESGGYVDGDYEIRGSKHRRDSIKEGYTPEYDVNSQWGRPSQRQERRERRQSYEQNSSIPDRSSRQTARSQPSRQKNDDFFESLMADLSNDLDGKNERRQEDTYDRRGSSSSQRETSRAGRSDDDDFFATLMSEISDGSDERASNRDGGISNPGSTRRRSTGRVVDGKDDGDFFASLEREIESAKKPIAAKSNDSDASDTKSISPVEELVDVFGQLEATDTSIMGDRTTFTDDSDDFFSSLEADLAEELGNASNYKGKSKSPTSFNIQDDDGDAFFAALETELESDQNSELIAPQFHKATSELDSSSSAKKAVEVNSLTVPELKDMLRQRGLKVSGKKSDLIERFLSSK